MIRPETTDLNRVVARRIFHAILDGRFPPGSILPNEHTLSADLGVSRTALREAIKGLSSKGLVETRRKRGTLVLEAQHWSMLDKDIVSWSRRAGSEEVSRQLWDAVRIIQPQLAREAALRRNPGKLSKLAGSVEDAGTAIQRMEAYVAAMLEIAHLSRNRFLFSLVANALGNLRTDDDASLLQWSNQLRASDIFALSDDIAAGNATAAEQKLQKMLGPFVTETA